MRWKSGLAPKHIHVEANRGEEEEEEEEEEGRGMCCSLALNRVVQQRMVKIPLVGWVCR